MRNAALEAVGALVGTWRLTLSDAWFLEDKTPVHGTGTISWLDDAFLLFRSDLGGAGGWTIVIGRSDAREAFTALYHDERGVLRVFAMTFTGDSWTLTREDPDFHQRFVARVEPDRIVGHWDASEDAGTTWRKDFDLTFDRA